MTDDDNYGLQIEGFENYCIFENGDVINITTKRVLKQFKNRKGYLFVGISKNGKRTHKSIHRLLAEAYLNNHDNKPCVDHIDNNRTNNHIDNLRWATIEENNWNKILAKNNKSGYKGVDFDKFNQVWRCSIRHKGKYYHLGRFQDIEEAIKARTNKAKELQGEYVNKCEANV